MNASKMSHPEIHGAAREAYDLARYNYGQPHEEALDSAIQHALRSHARAMLRDIFDWLCQQAEELDAAEPIEDSIAEDGVAAMLWAARELEDMIPLDDRHVDD